MANAFVKLRLSGKLRFGLILTTMKTLAKSGTRQHRVVALVQPPLSHFELACAAEVFGTDRPGLASHYDFAVCTMAPGRLTTNTFYDVSVDLDLNALDSADTVVVAGWPLNAQPAAEVIDALRRAHHRGARIVGLCSGAFLLAASGLLTARTATTHWRMASQLATEFPEVNVDPRVLYVDLGDVATSAGTAAAIDLCLYILRHDQGAAYASQVARHMVMPPHRAGGQTQYSKMLDARPSAGLGELTEWALARMSLRTTVEDLADHANQSSRTVSRRFETELGLSPGRWLLRQRLFEACRLLEDTDWTIDSIANRVGLSDEGNLRRRFKKLFQTTPSAYRETFQTPNR
jgi:AraC family transcriptional activator FtrA